MCIRDSIYSLPAGALHSRMHTTYGIQYINTKWLERVGKEMPTTMEEFHDVLVAFRDMDANGNGDATDEIPFDFCDKVYTSWLMKDVYKRQVLSWLLISHIRRPTEDT